MATIVVVDDDEDMRMLVEFKLTRTGHVVHTACDGREGLETCRRVRPELVVVDVNMPVMSGIEMLTRLRASPEFLGLPVVLVTALSRPSEVEAGLAAGATAYVTKPFSPRALAAQVDGLLQTALTG